MKLVLCVNRQPSKKNNNLNHCLALHVELLGLRHVLYVPFAFKAANNILSVVALFVWRFFFFFSFFYGRKNLHARWKLIRSCLRISILYFPFRCSWNSRHTPCKHFLSESGVFRSASHPKLIEIRPWVCDFPQGNSHYQSLYLSSIQ